MIIMKINKNELNHMISQIDDEFIQESDQMQVFSPIAAWKKCIPVAACIIFLLGGIAVCQLRGNETASTSGHSTPTEELAITDFDFTESLHNSELIPALESVKDTLADMGYSEDFVINSLDLTIIPESMVISEGSIFLSDTENTICLSVAIQDGNITYEKTSSDTETDEYEQATVSSYSDIADDSCTMTLSDVCNTLTAYTKSDGSLLTDLNIDGSSYLLLHITNTNSDEEDGIQISVSVDMYEQDILSETVLAIENK